MTQPSYCFAEQASTPETCRGHGDKMTAQQRRAEWNGCAVPLQLLILLNIDSL